MERENIKELEQIVNITGDYNSVLPLINNTKNFFECIAVKRSDLYNIFKNEIR
jgi:hypothetical protein